MWYLDAPLVGGATGLPKYHVKGEEEGRVRRSGSVGRRRRIGRSGRVERDEKVKTCKVSITKYLNDLLLG